MTRAVLSRSNHLDSFAGTLVIVLLGSFFSGHQIGAQDVSNFASGDFTGGLPLIEKDGKTLVESRVLHLRRRIAPQQFSSRLFPSKNLRLPNSDGSVFTRSKFEADDCEKKLDALKAANIETTPLEEIDVDFIARNTPFRLDELRQAAFSDESGWKYSSEQIPLTVSRVPELLVSHDYNLALAAEVRSCIKQGKFESAEQMISTMTGFQRHLGNQPYRVCQILSGSFQHSAVTALEELIQHPLSSNYYWDITNIPRLSTKVLETIQLEAAFVEKIVPNFESMEDVHEKETWDKLLKEIYSYFIEYQVEAGQKILPEMDSEAYVVLMKNWCELSRSRLPFLRPDLEGKLDQLSDSEVSVRYWMYRTCLLLREASAPALLSLPDALEQTAEEDRVILSQCKDELLVKLAVKTIQPFHTYIAAVARTEQSLALLQTVEAIRDWSAMNSGLPDSLDELRWKAPLDPATGKPFHYQLSEDAQSATLTSSAVGINAKRYKLEIVE